MKICSIIGCIEKYYAREYCRKHYVQWKKDFPIGQLPICIKKERVCDIRNCGKEHYAKGYCHNHYEKFIIRKNYPHIHKCKAENCEKTCYLDYCEFHRNKLKVGLPLSNIKCSPRGKRNVNWKGGISEYPNHYQMKKNRLIILMYNPKCEVCGEPATEVHHRDGSKTNHNLVNLMASCHKCNTRIRFITNKSKYRKNYGMTLDEISKRLGCSQSTCFRLHKKNKLKEILSIY